MFARVVLMYNYALSFLCVYGLRVGREWVDCVAVVDCLYI